MPYKYEFFHLVFSLGAMYFAMLFVSWNLENTTRKYGFSLNPFAVVINCDLCLAADYGNALIPMGDDDRWVIDVGWASTWVKIINEWLAATIYSA